MRKPTNNLASALTSLLEKKLSNPPPLASIISSSQATQSSEPIIQCYDDTDPPLSSLDDGMSSQAFDYDDYLPVPPDSDTPNVELGPIDLTQEVELIESVPSEAKNTEKKHAESPISLSSDDDCASVAVSKPEKPRSQPAIPSVSLEAPTQETFFSEDEDLIHECKDIQYSAPVYGQEQTAIPETVGTLLTEKVGLLEQKIELMKKALLSHGITVYYADLDAKLDEIHNQLANLDDDDDQSVVQPRPAHTLGTPQKGHRLSTFSPSPKRFRAEEMPSSPDLAIYDVDDISEVEVLETSSHYFDNKQNLDSDPPNSQTGARPTHAWTDETKSLLRNKFGLSKFRHQQRDIIDSTLSGRDTIVLMPTGGGKSLCFQLPALCTKGVTTGTTVVISPLISLMQDQVFHLRNKNIAAGMINSTLDARAKEQAFAALSSGEYKLVYLSPEMLSLSDKMRTELSNLYRSNKLARLVIDEAHCVSSWGHDFREDYLKLDLLKQWYPKTPIMALTGTANSSVLSDISRCVRPGYNLFKQSFNRPNLHYDVEPKRKDVVEQITRRIRQNPNRRGIIFCHSQALCEQTAQKLRDFNVNAAFYHAGMDKQEREQLQHQWQLNKINVMCATIAFGMGVDKPDVRFVYHLTMPRSMEGFYQESGRAGRDGKPAQCTIFYSYADYTKLARFIESEDIKRQEKDRKKQGLDRVKQYCENQTDCRRKQILQYFDEFIDVSVCNGTCDTCRHRKGRNVITRDLTEQASLVVKTVARVERDSVTIMQVIDILRGSRVKKVLDNHYDDLEYYGSFKSWSRTELERFMHHLVAERYLREYVKPVGKWASHSYIQVGAQSLNGAKVTMDYIEGQDGAGSESFNPRIDSAGQKKDFASPSRSSTSGRTRRVKFRGASRAGHPQFKRSPAQRGGRSTPISRSSARPSGVRPMPT